MHLPFDCYVDVQADEPEIDPSLIDEVVQQLEQHPEWDCATAACSRDDDDLLAENWNMNHVKVVHQGGLVVDFQRYIEDCGGVTDYDHLPDFDQNGPAYHIGIYAYRREALLKYAAAGPCEREVNESLEQLRALHIGLRMGVVLTDHQSHGIDTREDYDSFVARWKAEHP